MAATKKQRIRCSKCNKTVCYIPKGYELNIDITCTSCNSTKKKKKNINTVTANYARTKKGIREDVHPLYSFRSATEANFARLLNYWGITWRYEERSFTFSTFKKPPFVYVMDFIIDKVDKRHKDVPKEITEGFIEVKGYMNASSRQKLRRLKKEYPEEANNTTIIIYSHYNKKDKGFCERLGYKFLYYDLLQKEYKDKIKGWE
jgi:hypothetical protein